MVDEEGQVKVIDFGISAPVATAPTGQGVFGSPGHMPPEQMEGKELTPAADVFAVAVLLMELWSGKAPFRRRTMDDIKAAMKGPHPKPSAIDIRLLPLDEVMASAMAVDPKQRPQQADDLARALRRFLTGVDLGDVARQLGDRVRALRANPLPPSSDQKPVLQRPPSRGTAMQMGTKTFAARSDIGPWKEVGEKTPVADGGESPGTRRLASSRPAPPPKDIETVATRPIETDPREDKPATPSRRGAVWVGAAGALALAVAAFFLGKGAGPATVDTSPTATGTAATSAVTTSTAPGPTAPPSAGSTATVVPVATTSAPAATTATAPTTDTTASSAAAERATLVLLGDGTFVTVDGVPRGPAPARVAVEAGAHAVLFTFPATGESKGKSLVLKAGERATLYADFTGATPTIRQQR
jgi:serine/threonine-protein kinase